MTKKIFIATTYGAGSEDVQFAALLWAKKRSTAVIRPIGKLGNFVNMPADASAMMTEEQDAKFIAVSKIDVFDTALAETLIVPGWKVTAFLNALYAEHGDDSAFVLVRRVPDEVSQSHAKKVFLARNEEMIGIVDEEQFLARTNVMSHIVNSFAETHNLTWVKAAREVFDDNLDVIPSTMPEKTTREVTIIKGPNF